MNVVSPGADPDANPGKARNAGEEFLENIKNQIPIKRCSTPEEVGTAVLFSAANEAAYITGADLYVDGGAGQI